MATQTIFAKINPPISLAQQSNLFNQTVTYEIGDYMTAIAVPYVLGSDLENFRVFYGRCDFDESGSVISFKTIHSQTITLSGTVIENWGENDDVILQAIANQEGITIEKIVSGNIENIGMFF
jgi:hypothetical protein